MLRHLDTELQELKDILLEMGGAVEKSVEEACLGVLKRQPQRFKEAHRLEKRINELHLDVDQACFALLAKQAPVARDLRLAMAVIKINTDLERMGDQAVNISYSGQDYLNLPGVPEVSKDLESMVEEVRAMTRDSLDAFVKRDVVLSQNVLSRDDIVDRFKDKIIKQLRDHMVSNPEQIDSCLCLMSVAKNLERLADHATNIAEDVIFFTTGDDIRHGQKDQGSGA